MLRDLVKQHAVWSRAVRVNPPHLFPVSSVYLILGRHGSNEPKSILPAVIILRLAREPDCHSTILAPRRVGCDQGKRHLVQMEFFFERLDRVSLIQFPRRMVLRTLKPDARTILWPLQGVLYFHFQFCHLSSPPFFC